jgi:hypothetical protein
MQDDAIPALEFTSEARCAHDLAPGGVSQRWLDGDGRLVAVGGACTSSWWMRWTALGTYEFGPSGSVVVAAEPHADPAVVHDSFIRGVLPVALLAREYEVLHGSAVGTRDGGVAAFCARSGTGKSSLALGLTALGRAQWADDSIAFRILPDGIDVTRLPFPSRVDGAARAALSLPEARAAGSPRPGSRAPLRAIYVMVRDDGIDPGVPAIDLVPARARFERLLAHAHPFELAGADRMRRMIERYLSAAALPMYELRFAPALPSLPTLVAAVDRHLASIGDPR